MERIAVIGTGYVGLVAGALFAQVGHKVICADIDQRKINALSQGNIPIYEPGLAEIVKKTSALGTLTFTTDVDAAISSSTAIFIAVGTPSGSDGSYDGKYILSALDTIRSVLVSSEQQRYVIIKSTITPEIYRQISAKFSDLSHVHIISNPEFMAEGTAVRDFSQPNRIIIGTDSSAAADFMRRIYREFVKKDPNRLIVMGVQSAITSKLASNAMLALKVSFINEIARYCDAFGADIEEVRAGLSSDPRIGPHFLYAGPGYGGSCFPKDVRALDASGRGEGLSLSLIGAIHESNECHKHYLSSRVQQHVGDLSGKRIAVWGLAFKARTDDVRDSPALALISDLADGGAVVSVHDPEAMENARAVLNDTVTYCTRKEDALVQCDALIIVTEWDEYKSPDYAALPRLVFDGRNILSREEAAKAGITVIGIGR